VALMYGYGYGLGVNTLWLVPLAVLAMAVALAFGLWLSALNVLYRDVQYVIPFLIQLWMFISPVAYVVKLHGYANIIYGLNPLTGVIEGFRWALLGGTPPGRMFALSCGIVAFLLVTGLIYFKRMERSFADVV
jgi:lipopolysaccharide transport system permease protein